MTNMEKVIEDLNIARYILASPQTPNREMCIRIGQAISAAIDLLKKQEPKLVQNNRTSFNPNYEEGDCPSCGERITTNSYLKSTRYCKYCGQAVKWEC